MGTYVSKAMDESMRKNQLAMRESQQLMLERQIQMQNYMREQMMAAQIARGRDLFHWWASFYTVAILAMARGYAKTKKPSVLVPALPLTFVVAYIGDMAYGSKMTRIKASASHILQDELTLVDLPSGIPSIEVLDERIHAEKSKAL